MPPRGICLCYRYIGTQYSQSILSVFSPLSLSTAPATRRDAFSRSAISLGSVLSWRYFGLAAFLVSIPVFFEAPLVRHWPLVSLVLTFGWIGLGQFLTRHASRTLLGDMVLGFAWSWLAGSIYWGWFRWEPLLHLPIEAIGLPVAVWAILRQRYPVGAFFYLGSLFGTAITDLYFYIVGLIPYWRQVMMVDLEGTFPILQSALQQMQTPWGVGWALALVLVLCVSGLLPLVSAAFRQGVPQALHWWTFSGAVLSTLLVDGLFWVTVQFA